MVRERHIQLVLLFRRRVEMELLSSDHVHDSVENSELARLFISRGTRKRETNSKSSDHHTTSA